MKPQPCTTCWHALSAMGGVLHYPKCPKGFSIESLLGLVNPWGKG